MFGWFRPSCPCDVEAKAWIEERLHWLWEEFPDNVYNGRKVILPLDEYFPDKYDRSFRSVRAMLDRICGYMEVDPDRVDLHLTDDKDPGVVNSRGDLLPGAAAGTFSIIGDRFRITVDKPQLHEPMHLAGTLGHELAHARLLGEDRCHPDIFDHELLTDLTTVFLGMGIFLANVPRHWLSTDQQWPGTKLRKPEYLSAPMYGWALAHLAWHHQERSPSWAKHLEFSPRVNMKQGLKYLWTTEDSSFKP